MPDRSTPKSAPPASASDNPAPEDLPPMGRPSLDDFLAASEPAAPDHARMDDLPPLGRPSLEDFPDAPDDRSASGDPAAGKNGRVRDEARPPGTRAQKIRTAIIAVFLVFLAYMCWPVGPRDEILMARLPAEYRIAAEARGALDLLTLFERAELADRFWGGSLGGRLARVDLDAEGDRDADAEDASLPARSPYTAWRDGVRQVSDFFASPGGTRFMGSGLNGSIMAAATDPSLDDAVLVVHSVRLARAWFAWKAWASGEDHPVAGRVWRWWLGGRDFFCQSVDGLLVAATRAERLPVIVAAMRPAAKPAADLPPWAEPPLIRPAVLVRWCPPPAPDADAGGDAGFFPAFAAFGRAADSALAERGVDEAVVAFVVNGRRLGAGMMGRFAPGRAPVFAAHCPRPLNPEARPDAAAAGDSFAYIASADAPELIPPNALLRGPHGLVYGRLPARAAWRELGRLVWGGEGRPLRGIAANEARLGWSVIEDGLLPGMDGRVAFSVTPPPLTTPHAVPPLPEVFFATGILGADAVAERLPALEDQWLAALHAPSGGEDGDALRRTIAVRRHPLERHTVTQWFFPDPLVNFAEPAWTLLREADDTARGKPGAFVLSSHAPRLVQPEAVPPPSVDVPPHWLDLKTQWRTDAAFVKSVFAVLREKAVTQADLAPDAMAARARALDWIEAAADTVVEGGVHVLIPYADEAKPDRFRVQLQLGFPDAKE